ncbi:MAG TPA: aminotransferase class I/II-fold pyridoxal phosphate-dependent enzyme [Egibacteraceae bacterium]|nr:aminotransferase class I/II-fold pyridoxal phosphate-dependent enzyme [Egibacteraceae bacterium]
MSRTSAKSERFAESVIREMTRLAAVHSTPERPVINLAQGFPDFPAPAEVKSAAQQAIADDINQYAVTWGAPRFRAALAAKYARDYAWPIDPETEITVTCGATEGMIASLLAVIDPGDEVIVFEPFYENYGPDAVLSGAVPVLVPLSASDGFALDPDALRAAITPRTRGVIVNSPNNPTGKVLTRQELGWIADVCVAHDLVAFTDEIYEHITYDGAQHVPLATIDGMAERTCTVSALSKTYSVTGWRVGWVIAPADLTAAIRKVHDFLTVGAAAPLQEAGAVAVSMPESYYAELGEFYQARRDVLLPALSRAGLTPVVPAGAYYAMADCSPFGDDLEFTRRLITDLGVAVVPGSSFFSDPADGRGWVRFAFCKRIETLQHAAERLEGLRTW